MCVKILSDTRCACVRARWYIRLYLPTTLEIEGLDNVESMISSCGTSGSDLRDLPGGGGSTMTTSEPVLVVSHHRGTRRHHRTRSHSHRGGSSPGLGGRLFQFGDESRSRVVVAWTWPAASRRAWRVRWYGRNAAGRERRLPAAEASGGRG